MLRRDVEGLEDWRMLWGCGRGVGGGGVKGAESPDGGEV